MQSNTPMYNGGGKRKGRADTITGSSVYYAGGGGSGMDTGQLNGLGGQGGGLRKRATQTATDWFIKYWRWRM